MQTYRRGSFLFRTKRVGMLYNYQKENSIIGRDRYQTFRFDLQAKWCFEVFATIGKILIKLMKMDKNDRL